MAALTPEFSSLSSLSRRPTCRGIRASNKPKAQGDGISTREVLLSPRSSVVKNPSAIVITFDIFIHDPDLIQNHISRIAT